MTILAAFDALAFAQGERPAIIDGKGRIVSFAALYHRAGYLADEWAKRGIGPGDRVLIAMGVTPDLYAALAAFNQTRARRDDARAQVNFPRHGTKWLALSVAKLTVVD